jgi:hypothetical protein
LWYGHRDLIASKAGGRAAVTLDINAGSVITG